MKTMSAIYQKVRHRLNDDWAYGNGNTFLLLLDTRHEKTDLKVFVVVIPKEGWPRPSFFWYDTDFLEFESFDFIDHIL